MERENVLLFLTTVQIAATALYTAWKLRKNKRWRNRRWWVRPIMARREEHGDFATLFQELKEDPVLFFRYTRMNVPTFYELLHLISPHITKRSARPSISAEQRLAITLRFLATGDQVLSIALAYRIGESTAHEIIKETCAVIANVLSQIYLQPPTENTWKEICLGFLQDWNLPNCVGAVDGKHIVIQAPRNSGSLYFNYKKTFSVVLMATCTHNYKFTLFDVGAYGSENDSGVMSKSSFGQAFSENKLNLPQGYACLPGSKDLKTPCYFVGDAAFHMTKNLMRPFPGKYLSDVKKIFNYRLSRARRVIENTFGILVSRWRIFRRPICANPNVVDRIVLAAVCLHNFLKTKNDEQPALARQYCPPKFIDTDTGNGEVVPGEWRENGEDNNLLPMGNIGAHRAAKEAYEIRDRLASYFITPTGQIPWQYDYIQRGKNQN